MKERLEALIQALGISKREFCRIIGKSSSYMNSLGDNMGVDVLLSILRSWPNVNEHWLITGEGEIFDSSESRNIDDKPSGYHINNNYKAICEDLRMDNKQLRDEANQLRKELLEQIRKNEKLMIENVQLSAKLLSDMPVND